MLSFLKISYFRVFTNAYTPDELMMVERRLGFSGIGVTRTNEKSRKLVILGGGEKAVETLDDLRTDVG